MAKKTQGERIYTQTEVNKLLSDKEKQVHSRIQRVKKRVELRVRREYCYPIFRNNWI